MDAGLIAALAGDRDARSSRRSKSTRCTCRTSPTPSTRAVIVLLNLSRDQLDRVGEINHIERTLRGGLARHGGAVVVANCDDVLMTSAAYDSPNVVWVAAGGSWANDSVSCPRSGEIIVREESHWYSTGTDFKRPTPAVVVRRRQRLRTRRPDPADDAGAARRGQPRQRHAGGRGGRRPRRRSRRGGRRGVRRRRGRGPLPHRAARCSTPCGCCWPRIPRAGRRRCRWSTSTARAS